MVFSLLNPCIQWYSKVECPWTLWGVNKLIEPQTGDGANIQIKASITLAFFDAFRIQSPFLTITFVNDSFNG